MSSLISNKKRRRELAYIAGLVASDGHIDRDSTSIEISTNNERFAYKVASMLSRLTTNKVSVYRYPKIFVVNVHDKELKETLVKKFNIPPGTKAHLLRPPKLQDEREILNFIRGFCDGDSSVHSRKMRGKEVPRIRIMSTSKKMLEWIRRMLIKAKIGCSKPFKDIPHGFGNKMNWRIEIYGRNVVKFMKKIDYFHPEKQRRLEIVCSLLPSS